MPECKDNSFYCRLGRRGVVKLVWRAIPWQFRIMAFPYCLSVYSRVLAECSTVGDVRAMHSKYYGDSRLFKFFRPRFRLIRKALLPLDATSRDVAEHMAGVTPYSLTPGSPRRVPVPVESARALRQD